MSGQEIKYHFVPYPQSMTELSSVLFDLSREADKNNSSYQTRRDHLNTHIAMLDLVLYFKKKNYQINKNDVAELVNRLKKYLSTNEINYSNHLVTRYAFLVKRLCLDLRKLGSDLLGSDDLTNFYPMVCGDYLMLRYVPIMKTG